MAIYPNAVLKIVPRFDTPMRARRVNLHTAVSNTTSLYSYFRPAGRVCSHFYVREDGTVEQYVDTAYMAAADLKGNPDTISIETWDGYRRVWTQAGDIPPWTPRQVAALANLVLWISRTHGIPLTRLRNSLPGSRGVSYHRLGVPWRKWMPYRSGWLIPGGLRYSNSYGKLCPGDARIAQVDDVIALAARGGTTVVSRANPRGYAMTYVREVQSLLNAVAGEGLLVDGVLGPITEAAVRRYQASRLLVVDGDPGPITMGKLRAEAAARDSGPTPTSPARYPGAYVREVQSLLNATIRAGLLVDGDLGPVTVAAVRRYQAARGLVVDGDPGPITLGRLRAETTPAPVPAFDPTHGGIFPLRVDGVWGPITTAGLQVRLAVPQTRRLDRVTVVRMQDLLGVRQDGDFGPVSKQALKNRLGVTEGRYGYFGPRSTRSLQARLNGGRF